MISNEYSIEVFAELLKDKDSQTVIAMAVQEATEADRLVLKKNQHAQTMTIQNYSRQLKQLISYHRYAVKPRQPKRTTYNLYMKYWGQADPLDRMLHESTPAVRKFN
jgi:hypothetical protein